MAGELTEKERVEEEDMAEGLRKLLQGKAQKWPGDPVMRESLQRTQGAWIEILLDRFRKGEFYADSLRQRGETGLAEQLHEEEVALRDSLGTELYELFPCKPTRQEAERMMCFSRIVKAKGIAVPSEPGSAIH